MHWSAAPGAPDRCRCSSAADPGADRCGGEGSFERREVVQELLTGFFFCGPRSLTSVLVFGCSTCAHDGSECLDMYTCNRP